MIELTSSYINQRLRMKKKGNHRAIDFDSIHSTPTSTSRGTSWTDEQLSSSWNQKMPISSSSTSTFWNEKTPSSSSYNNYISSREAYRRLNKLLKSGVNFYFYIFFNSVIHITLTPLQTKENLNAVTYDE